MKGLYGGLLTVVLAMNQASGCGLSFSELPKTYFDGVEEHGYVSYWEKLGEVALDEKTQLAVSCSFKSHQEAVSPYLGKGWSIPFLESHVEPLSEDSFEILMPDGLLYDFGRTAPGSDTYSGSRGWLAQTNGQTLTTWAPCGWRIIFEKGKISQIVTPGNKTIEYQYNGPVVMEVVEDGKTLAKAESMGSAGITDVIIGDQKIDITLGRRPQIFTKLAQNLIIGFDQSLNTLQWSDGKKESFAFGTDKNINPTLIIKHADQSQRAFTWDATTRQIKIDGEWIYDLSPGTNIALERTNAKGQVESYDDDSANGITTVLKIDGVRLITKRFVNAGLLSGKVRNVTQVVKGISTVIKQYNYDETGKLIRKIDEKGLITKYAYDAKGLLSTISTPDNQIIWHREDINGIVKQTVKNVLGEVNDVYPRSSWKANDPLMGTLSKVRPALMEQAAFLQVEQKKGIITERLLQDSKRLTLARADAANNLWEYSATLNIRTTYLNGSKYCDDILDGNGHVMEQHIFKDDSTIPSQIQKYTYDDKYRATKIVTIDTASRNKSVVKFAYDDQNRLTEQMNSTSGTYHYFYSPSGERKQSYSPPSKTANEE